jgi:hypothetical protein
LSKIMSTRVADRVESWEDRPFEGGFRELHELADREFSGVVRAGGAELFMTKGTVVGVRQGSIETFEGATGTVYEAPTPALPLLAVMQDRNDEVRAKYYTEETSISKVDGKLADGNFTGFIELSENVLSGDYYLVYHQGHSMSVAFVGESARLIDGDDAFEQADGEVGIYQVRPADIEVIEIPEPSEPEADPSDSTSAGAAVADTGPDPEEGTEEDESETETTAPDATDEQSSPASDAGTADSETSPDRTTETPGDSEGMDSPASNERQTETVEEASPGPAAEDPPAESASTDDATPDQETEEQAPSEPSTTRSERDARGGDPDRASSQGQTEQDRHPAGGSGTVNNGRQQSASSQDAATGQRGRQNRERTEQEPAQTTSGSTERGQSAPAGAGRDSEQPATTNRDRRALETRAIPSLDPGRTETPERTTEAGGRTDSPSHRQDPQSRQPSRPAGTEQTQTSQTRSEPESEPESEQPPEQNESGEDPPETQPPAASGPDPDRIAELEEEIEDREEEIDQLESQLNSVAGERDNLRQELEEVREERDDLADQVERLETELERLETEFGAATDAERRMTPREALDGTDIFVRYDSKGDATLGKAHDGGVRRSDVDDNLRLEKHTQFDTANVAVGGQTFTEFLEDTLEFQFVEWVIRELLFEIRDTGHSGGLRNLFDAIPKVDRAELNGAVNVVYTEEGQETRTTEAFDVVLRDRMGDPLLVANLNDSREAATEGDMENLVTAAERVGQTSEDFSAAFLVTRSFFEPGALETASEATRGGLLSRDKRRSFVNLSRKRGYHLCLVEARNRNFNLAVPEL